MTAAAGMIGAVLRRRLKERYDLRLLTHLPAGFPSLVVDLGDREGLDRAFAGANAVVHLAAVATVDA